MINPYYFCDENFRIGFKNISESHNSVHANYILTITANFPDIQTETSYIFKILKDLTTFYARLINQYKFKYYILISASFYKIKEEDQRSDETEKYKNMNTNNKLTESDFENIYVKTQLEHQIQIQKTKEKGWIFDEINAMKIRFYKTCELNGVCYVKNPLRSNASKIFHKNDKYSFIWSILLSLLPCDKGHPYRISNYRQYFNKLKIKDLMLVMNSNVIMFIILRN